MNNWKKAALDALHIACYQHACLLYENNLNLTNKTHLQNMYHTFHSMDSFSLQSKSTLIETFLKIDK